MERKSFFKKRTPRGMHEQLQMKKVYWQRGLVERVWDLQDNEGIILMSPIIPLKFLRGSDSQATSSRKDYRWGNFLPVKQPQTQEEAHNCAPYIPLIGRMQAFDDLRGVDQRDLSYVGISWRPVQGTDRVLRIVPFDAVVDAVSILNYAHSTGTGIDVDMNYIDANIVQREGGKVICKVPSRTKKRGKYRLTLNHVPLLPGKEENAVILSLNSSFMGFEPERGTYLHDLRYASAPGRQVSDRVIFGPHEIAAYLETIREEVKCKGLDGAVPLRMNPFPLPAREFFQYGQKLDNNVLIFDPTLQSKDKLRNLHLDERSIMLGRAIPVRGAWNTVYWDPQRDGPLVKYKS